MVLVGVGSASRCVVGKVSKQRLDHRAENKLRVTGSLRSITQQLVPESRHRARIGLLNAMYQIRNEMNGLN